MFSALKSKPSKPSKHLASASVLTLALSPASTPATIRR